MAFGSLTFGLCFIFQFIVLFLLIAETFIYIYIFIYISHMILDIYILYFPMTNENIDNIDIVVIDSENKTLIYNVT